MYKHHPVPQGSLSHELMNYTVELTLPPGRYKFSVKAGNPFGCSESSEVVPMSGIEGTLITNDRELKYERKSGGRGRLQKAYHS